MYQIFRDHNVRLNCFEEGSNGSFQNITKQKMFVRTNCLDCLDRTNAVQAKLAFLAFIQAVEFKEKLGILKK